MLGHVTSSYLSAELERPFALALLTGGRDRIGDVVHVPHQGRWSRSRSPDPSSSTRKEPAVTAESIPLPTTHPLDAHVPALAALSRDTGATSRSRCSRSRSR